MLWLSSEAMSFIAVLFALLLEQIKPLPRNNVVHYSLASWVGWTGRNFDAGKPLQGLAATWKLWDGVWIDLVLGFLLAGQLDVLIPRPTLAEWLGPERLGRQQRLGSLMPRQHRERLAHRLGLGSSTRRQHRERLGSPTRHQHRAHPRDRRPPRTRRHRVRRRPRRPHTRRRRCARRR